MYANHRDVELHSGSISLFHFKLLCRTLTSMSIRCQSVNYLQLPIANTSHVLTISKAQHCSDVPLGEPRRSGEVDLSVFVPSPTSSCCYRTTETTMWLHDLILTQLYSSSSSSCEPKWAAAWTSFVASTNGIVRYTDTSTWKTSFFSYFLSTVWAKTVDPYSCVVNQGISPHTVLDFWAGRVLFRWSSKKVFPRGENVWPCNFFPLEIWQHGALGRPRSIRSVNSGVGEEMQSSRLT